SIKAIKSGVTDKYKLFIVVNNVKDVERLTDAVPEHDHCVGLNCLSVYRKQSLLIILLKESFLCKLGDLIIFLPSCSLLEVWFPRY
ncbi:hypothetical protein NE611_17365, partial [Anaerostipes caccae]|nr:hypothetical protein [Anaerostipes caccae]